MTHNTLQQTYYQQDQPNNTVVIFPTLAIIRKSAYHLCISQSILELAVIIIIKQLQCRFYMANSNSDITQNKQDNLGEGTTLSALRYT